MIIYKNKFLYHFRNYFAESDEAIYRQKHVIWYNIIIIYDMKYIEYKNNVIHCEFRMTKNYIYMTKPKHFCIAWNEQQQA